MTVCGRGVTVRRIYTRKNRMKLNTCARMYTYTHGARTLGETRVSSESVAKSRSHSDKARGYARRGPLGMMGEGAGTSCFPFSQHSVILNISKQEVTKRNYGSRYHTYLRINNKANCLRDYRQMTENRAEKVRIKVLKRWEPNFRDLCMGNKEFGEISAGEAEVPWRRTMIPPLRGVLP